MIVYELLILFGLGMWYGLFEVWNIMSVAIRHFFLALCNKRESGRLMDAGTGNGAHVCSCRCILV